MFGLKKIIKLFDLGNVSISGLRGSGKDVLMSNVVARRKQKSYISNIDYKIKGKKFIPLELSKFDIRNDYTNFISGNYNRYIYPYPEDIDVYISDIGTYFPSQYNGSLDKDYKSFTSYMALSRHLGNNNLHYNVQNLNRVWNKVREQSDIYIKCKWCKVLFHKIVISKVMYYEKYESCLDNVPKFKLRLPLLHSRNGNLDFRIERERYRIKYGVVRSFICIYIHKSKYDDRIFKNLLEKGVVK